MWGIVLIIFFVTGSRQITITEFSVPEAVEAGGDVLLKCGYELSASDREQTASELIVKWWFTPLNESDDMRSQLYQRIGGQTATKTNDDIEIKDNDDILLKIVTPERSGTYECEVSAIEDEKRQHDDLIVFSKGELVLNVTEVEDGPDADNEKDIQITCEATDVAPYPDLAITLNNEVLTTNETVLDQGNNTYYVTSSAILSKEQADGKLDISCELFYANANITHEQFKISQTFNAGPSALTTTEDFEDASTTEATPVNRVFGAASSLLLVISALVINVFTL